MGELKVTIGLCVKNCEKTVRGAVESIINQNFSHAHMELIIVDGRSKDGTMFIIKECLVKTDIKTRTYIDEGTGLGAARQIVLDNALGKYIVQLDGDIVTPRDYVRKQVEFMDRNPRVGMVRGEWKIQDGSSLVATLESMRVIDIGKKNSNNSTSRHLIGNAGSMYRTQALSRIGGWDKHVDAGEDVEVSARLVAAGWLLSINQEVYHAFRETWKDLWKEYLWWGYGAHYVNHKHKRALTLWRVFPVVAFASGLLYSSAAYKETHRKSALFLPLHSVFKRIAWWVGFVKSHIDGHGHSQKQVSE